MKNILLLIAILFAGACSATHTMKSVAGIYEGEDKDGTTGRVILLENGSFEVYLDGEKDDYEPNWNLVGKEIHVEYFGTITAVYKIEANGNLTWIGRIRDGKREDASKENRFTLKEIK